MVPGPASFDERLLFLATLTGTVCFPPEILGLWRRHGAATTVSLGFLQESQSAVQQIKLGMSSGSGVFAHLANMSQSKADFADRAAQKMEADGAPGQIVAGAAAYYQRRAETFRRRARLHGVGGGWGERWKTFGAMLGTGAYRRHRSGGLGLQSLLKDLFVAGTGRGRA